MANERECPVAVDAESLPARTGSAYPEPFASMMAMAGRTKRALGNPFDLASFGVNLTRLAPGIQSALRHAHTRQDEFIYVLEGVPTLITDAAEIELRPGMCAGFAAGTGDAHHLVNRSDNDVVYLEVGGRDTGDEVTYPDDDLVARFEDDRWQFFHKDGRPY